MGNSPSQSEFIAPPNHNEGLTEKGKEDKPKGFSSSPITADVKGQIGPMPMSLTPQQAQKGRESLSPSGASFLNCNNNFVQNHDYDRREVTTPQSLCSLSSSEMDTRPRSPEQKDEEVHLACEVRDDDDVLHNSPGDCDQDSVSLKFVYPLPLLDPRGTEILHWKEEMKVSSSPQGEAVIASLRVSPPLDVTQKSFICDSSNEQRTSDTLQKTSKMENVVMNAKFPLIPNIEGDRTCTEWDHELDNNFIDVPLHEPNPTENVDFHQEIGPEDCASSETMDDERKKKEFNIQPENVSPENSLCEKDSQNSEFLALEFESQDALDALQRDPILETETDSSTAVGQVPTMECHQEFETAGLQPQHQFEYRDRDTEKDEASQDAGSLSSLDHNLLSTETDSGSSHTMQPLPTLLPPIPEAEDPCSSTESSHMKCTETQILTENDEDEELDSIFSTAILPEKLETCLPEFDLNLPASPSVKGKEEEAAKAVTKSPEDPTEKSPEIEVQEAEKVEYLSEKNEDETIATPPMEEQRSHLTDEREKGKAVNTPLEDPTPHSPEIEMHVADKAESLSEKNENDIILTTSTEEKRSHPTDEAEKENAVTTPQKEPLLFSEIDTNKAENEEFVPEKENQEPMVSTTPTEECCSLSAEETAKQKGVTTTTPPENPTLYSPEFEMHNKTEEGELAPREEVQEPIVPTTPTQGQSSLLANEDEMKKEKAVTAPPEEPSSFQPEMHETEKENDKPVIPTTPTEEPSSPLLPAHEGGEENAVSGATPPEDSISLSEKEGKAEGHEGQVSFPCHEECDGNCWGLILPEEDEAELTLPPQRRRPLPTARPKNKPTPRLVRQNVSDEDMIRYRTMDNLSLLERTFVRDSPRPSTATASAPNTARTSEEEETEKPARPRSRPEEAPTTTCKVLALFQENKALRAALVEYEKRVAELTFTVYKLNRRIDDMQQDKEKITQHRDAALEDLVNVERSFTDLHDRYERAKGTMTNLKVNEQTLVERDGIMMQKLRDQEEKLALYKEQANAKMQVLYNDYEAKIEQNESDMGRLRAHCRLLEVRVHSLEKDLEHRLRENCQLNELCSEFINAPSPKGSRVRQNYQQQDQHFYGNEQARK